MTGAIIAAAIVAFLITSFVFVTAGYCYIQAFHMPEKKKKLDPRTFYGSADSDFCREPMVALVNELLQIPCETVSITSRDGLRLMGRLYRFSEEAKVEILFHGWHSSGLRDASGGAMMAREYGYNVLIVDQRSHGDSEGNTTTFGIKERYDCVDWVNFIIERFGQDVKILLGGVSMGASTVLMASGLKELPPQVKGVTADCSFSSPEAIIRKVCRDRKINDRFGYPFLQFAAKFFGGFSLKDGGAVGAVKRAKVPIMIVHGEGDDFVPYSMGEEIFAACTGEKYFLSVPNAGHGLSYFYETERYIKEVGDFKRRAFDRE